MMDSTSRVLKYIVITEDNPVVFDPIIPHNSFTNVGHITSAGFCRVFYDRETKRIKYHCYGESTSLKIKSQESDSALLTKVLGTY